MIDWLKLKIPINHYPIETDRVLRVSHDGEPRWEYGTWETATGSYESSLRIKSRGPENLQIDGNLIKYLQGHNIWGSNDVQGVIIETLDKLQPILKTNYSVNELYNIVQASFIDRIDCTESYPVGSKEYALSFIRALEQCAHLSHRGSGQMRGNTCYWGKNSRRWAMKAYAKGEEIKVHKLPHDLPFLDSIVKHADDLVRIEFVLRQTWLRELGLHKVSNWGENTVTDLHNELLGKLEITGQIEMLDKEIHELPFRLRLAYNAWVNGEDLKLHTPKATYYRYQRDLRKHGIDISIPRQVEKPKVIIDIREVITAIPSSVPDWAQDTPAYFEPRVVNG